MEACRRRQALVLHPASSHGVRTGKRLGPPGWGVLPYVGHIGMRRCEGYGFRAFGSRIGYHFSGN